MIGGATRGRGGPALGRHLADFKKQNEQIYAGASRGLVSESITDQVRELTEIGKYSSNSKPLYHVHADPSISYTNAQWKKYWQDFEKEFHLQKQKFTEVIHIKHGREHRHRVYSLVKPNGTCIRMDNDYARREKLNRLAELANGEKITKGRHNRAVVSALEANGQAKTAEALENAGITAGKTAGGILTPQERAQQERTRISKPKLASFIRNLWNSTQGNPVAFREAVESKSMKLANGTRGPVIIDSTGNVHAVNRLVNQSNKKDGLTTKTLKAAEVTQAFAVLKLSTYKEEKDGRKIVPKADSITKQRAHRSEQGTAGERKKDRENNGIHARTGRRDSGIDTSARGNRSSSGNKRPVAGTGRTSEISQQNARKTVAEARLRYSLRHAHMWGYLEEFRLEYPVVHIRVMDGFYLKRIRQEVDREQPDTDFLQRAYRDLSVFYVERYPKPWTAQNTDQTMERILELALMIINVLCQVLFGCSFAVGIQNYDDDLAKDVKAREMARGHDFEPDQSVRSTRRLSISAKKMPLG